jgi:hypothetical protein
MRFVGGASGSTVAGVIIGSGLIAIRQTRDGAPALADAASSDLAPGRQSLMEFRDGLLR